MTLWQTLLELMHTLLYILVCTHAHTLFPRLLPQTFSDACLTPKPQPTKSKQATAHPEFDKAQTSRISCLPQQLTLRHFSDLEFRVRKRQLWYEHTHSNFHLEEPLLGKASLRRSRALQFTGSCLDENSISPPPASVENQLARMLALGMLSIDVGF